MRNVKTGLIGVSILGLLGCMENQPLNESNLTKNSSIVDGEIKGANVYVNTNRTVVNPENLPGLTKVSGIWGTKTDWSGKVEIVTWDCSGSGNHADVSCSVDNSYVLVGGGAWADYGTGPGALLTSSYPADANLTTWRATSKDHIRTSYHTLHSYAVGMRLKDGSNNYISRSVVFSQMKVVSQSSSPATSWPEAQAYLPSGYQVTGGGGYVNYGTGSGNLLMKSAWYNGGWKTTSHDLINYSPATITAYVIGIQNPIPGFVGILVANPNATNNSTITNAGQIGTTYFDYSDGPISCYGAESLGDGTNFRFLYKMAPYLGGGHTEVVNDKDHVRASSGVLFADFITMETRRY